MVLMRSKDKDVGHESLDKIGVSICNRERIRNNRRLLLFCGNIIVIYILIIIIGFFFLCVIVLGIGVIIQLILGFLCVLGLGLPKFGPEPKV